jgi:hypothetical protein
MLFMPLPDQGILKRQAKAKERDSTSMLRFPELLMTRLK